MKQHDLTTMDLEGLSYSSELLREVMKKTENTWEILRSECLTDAEIKSLVTAEYIQLRTWICERLHDNSDAIDYHLEHILALFEE